MAQCSGLERPPHAGGMRAGVVVQPRDVVFGPHLQERTWTVTLERAQKEEGGLMALLWGWGKKIRPSAGMMVWCKVETMVNFPRAKN